MDIPITSTFRQKTSKAVFSIMQFILVYIILLVSAIGLTALCITGGIMLIAIKPMLFTIVGGFGLASIGVLILIFLIKFLFKRHKVDLSNYIEIQRKDQPKLFALIDSIVNEVGTSFPKKIYVSQEVNASVFYNSSFWSMFLPVKKNLHIGMGLVNTVTEDELKAILSHEFGHFSQKSMKVGSYVYNVNQIIFNMLYDNESYSNLVSSWASVSSYFILFVNIALKIIEGIQWILRKMYEVVNKSYMALSREMEFHADAVAANVTGYLPLKNSLLRMDLANKSYRDVIDFYNSKFDDALVSKNLFEEQTFVLQFLSKKDKLSLVNGLPYVSETNSKFKKSKLVIGNQWASHPETEDRIAALEKLHILKPETNTTSANLLFEKLPELQEKLTKIVFNDVIYSKDKVIYTIQDFKGAFQEKYETNSFNESYNGYYDSKNPSTFNLDEVSEFDASFTFDDLFNEDQIDLVYQELALQQDALLLEEIGNAPIDINSFDYEGIKYKSDEALQVKNKNEKEIKSLNASILLNDKKIYAYFKHLAKQKGCTVELNEKYHNFFNYDAVYEANFTIYKNIINGLQFTNQKTEYAAIKSNFKKLINDENNLKAAISKIMENPIFTNEITTSIRDNFDKYLSKDWCYFDGDSYYETSLKMFIEAVNTFQYLNHRGYFLIKKSLVDFQISLKK